MILEFPNYISPELIKKIKDLVSPFIDSSKPTEYNRDGYSVHISNIKELIELDNELHFMFNEIHKNIVAPRYNPQLSSGDSCYAYHIYNPNDICRYHADGEAVDGFLRYASVVINLNTVTDGGELVFPNQNKSIKSEEGKLIVFPPYGMYGHYTTPSSQPREVLVSWFIYKDIRIQNNAK